MDKGACKEYTYLVPSTGTNPLYFRIVDAKFIMMSVEAWLKYMVEVEWSAISF